MRSVWVRLLPALCVAASSAPFAVADGVGVQARGKIKHVVIIVQENRTFDDVFGGDPGI